MFEIVFLGTSASAPSIHRGLPAQAILAGEYRFLIDCGEGTQRQILRSGIGFKRLSRILLTHAHLDHILGLGGLVSTFARWENIESLEIYGGRATLDRVNALLFGVVLQYERLPIEISLLELQPGVILETKAFNVTAFPVQHRGSGNFGFVFQEHAHRPFLVEKAEALGVPAGPERGKLVAGQAVTLGDGRTITPEMVLGDAVRGAKLVHIGDIGRLDPVRQIVKDADALVIEVNLPRRRSRHSQPIRAHHGTASGDAGARQWRQNADLDPRLAPLLRKPRDRRSSQCVRAYLRRPRPRSLPRPPRPPGRKALRRANPRPASRGQLSARFD